MGYSPKHAKQVSLRGTALKTPLTGGPGRHRAGTRIPAPRTPGDQSVPDPVAAPRIAGEAAPAAEHSPAAGHAEETIAAGTRSRDRSGDKQAARAEAPMRLVPLQRAPVRES